MCLVKLEHKLANLLCMCTVFSDPVCLLLWTRSFFGLNEGTCLTSGCIGREGRGCIADLLSTLLWSVDFNLAAPLRAEARWIVGCNSGSWKAMLLQEVHIWPPPLPPYVCSWCVSAPLLLAALAKLVYFVLEAIL